MCLKPHGLWNLFLIDENDLMRFVAALLGLIAFATTGCGSSAGTGGGSAPATAWSPGPHGGHAVALPGDKGFAEVVIEGTKDPVPKKLARKVVLAVYFLQPDKKTALSSAPSGLSLTVQTPDKETATSVSLSAKPEKGDPAGATRFASEVGAYDFDELHGELTVTIDGQSVTKPFSLR